jgi:hypothetical protein
MNAINDALRPFNVKVLAQPFTPERILAALGKVPARYPEDAPSWSLNGAAQPPTSVDNRAAMLSPGGGSDPEHPAGGAPRPAADTDHRPGISRSADDGRDRRAKRGLLPRLFGRRDGS